MPSYDRRFDLPGGAGARSHATAPPTRCNPYWLAAEAGLLAAMLEDELEASPVIEPVEEVPVPEVPVPEVPLLMPPVEEVPVLEVVEGDVPVLGAAALPLDVSVPCLLQAASASAAVNAQAKGVR